jgi:RNA polymerase sigma factor (sigma-70 family)
VSPADRVEDLVRALAPQVLGAVVRRYGHFDAAEDAVQEALLAAAVQWPAAGVPDRPQAWLITVASRRLVDQLRADQTRRRREDRTVTLAPPAPGGDDAPADRAARDHDDTLTLLFLCCHPELTPASQVALTLRAVGGLTTAEIARAFLDPEPTMAQRISRAKARIRASGATFRLPPAGEREARLRVVLQVLYLIFNEGYTATSGDHLHRVELSAEAIRLTRLVRRLLPDDGEVAGLLALMLLLDARRPARTDDAGALVPLDEQDRSRWDAATIAEAVALLDATMAAAPLGPYQVQAAIAAVHAEPPTAEATDWPQISALYGVLERLAPGPMVTINRAVAVGMARGPQAGLDVLAGVADDARVAGHHRLAAVRAHLLERAGDAAGAREAYLDAARRTGSEPERRYLEARAARLGDGRPGGGTGGGTGGGSAV